jgi:hypothetical protein
VELDAVTEVVAMLVDITEVVPVVV